MKTVGNTTYAKERGNRMSNSEYPNQMDNEREWLVSAIEDYKHDNEEQAKEINYLREIIQSMTQLVVTENEEQDGFMQDVEKIIGLNQQSSNP